MAAPARGATRAPLAERVADAALLIGVAALPLALCPLQNLPFVDDWTYAFSVEHLLQHREIRLLDWASNWNVVHVLWGALFCLPFGFSFTALRASTWVLAAFTVVALAATLRELGTARREALLGALALAVNPLWVVLSVSFMTDVPFVAASTAAGYAMTRALRERSDCWLAAAALAGVAACGVRFVGTALVGAAVVALWSRGGAWGRRPAALLLGLSPLLLYVALWPLRGTLIVSPIDVSLVPSAMPNRVARLRWVLPSLPRLVPAAVLFAATAIGVALGPLAIALDTRGDARWRRTTAWLGAGAGGLLVAAAAFGLPYAPPLVGEATWTLHELGATEPLIPGYVAPSPPPALASAAAVLALGSCAAVAACAIARRFAPARAYLAWLIAGHVALITVLFLTYDRYALVLLPPAIVLFLTSGVRLRTARAALGLALYAALALVGLHDHLALNAALWQGVAQLEARGTPLAQIDGGYLVNGWTQYAHPENAPRDEHGAPFVPGVSVTPGALSTLIALRPLSGWRVIGHVPYNRILAGSGQLVVLERDR
jgi:dolichyl-phosphate-mannose-protein mannosyltransferase